METGSQPFIPEPVIPPPPLEPESAVEQDSALKVVENEGKLTSSEVTKAVELKAFEDNERALFDFIAGSVITQTDPDTVTILSNEAKKLTRSLSVEMQTESLVKTGQELKNRMVGFEGKDREQKLVISSFLEIISKKYFPKEVILSAFEKISLDTTKAKGKTAKLSGNQLTVFDSLFKSESKDFREELVFAILHEVGHVVDFSHVLEKEGGFEEETGEILLEDRLSEVVMDLPLEFHDSYVQGYLKEGDETGALLEAKANIIAMWSKNRGNPNGFVIGRLNTLNSDVLGNFFGSLDDSLKTNFFKAMKENDVNILEPFVKEDQKNQFKQFIENSNQIFALLEKNWQNAQQDPSFLEKISNTNGELDENLIFDDSESPSLIGTPSYASDTSNSGNLTGTAEGGTRNVGGNPGQSEIKPTTLGQVFASLKDVVASFSTIIPGQ